MNSNMEKPYVVGIDIGGTNTVFGIVDARGTIIATDSIKTGAYEQAENYVDEVCKKLLPLIVANGGVDKIKGIGVGAPNGNYYNGTIEIPEAIRKGKEDAIKKLVSVPVDENGTIPHDYVGKFGSASVLLKKAPEGTGVIAGGPARSVIELAGIKNIRTKSLGSNKTDTIERRSKQQNR